MKKLALVVSLILAAKIISHTPASGRPANGAPVGKVVLPIETSLQTWCAVTEIDCNNIECAKKAIS